MSKWSVKAKCRPCGGTGLYVGLAERDGSAVVCNRCKGSGCATIEVDYEPFRERLPRAGVTHVVQLNPGICIGTGVDGAYRLEDFGGQPVGDWADGKPFPPGSEMRRFTCPAWWYQCADYDKKPDWEECYRSLGGTFSQCPSFAQKAECWKRFDAEQAPTPTAPGDAT